MRLVIEKEIEIYIANQTATSYQLKQEGWSGFKVGN
jgi:hypothetical protein